MEPFRVTCETCRARLRVREVSAIGEIHACPKCGSMVHIVPPAGLQAEAAVVTAAPAVAPLVSPDFTHVPPPTDELADMFEAAASAIHNVEVVTSLPVDTAPADAMSPPAPPAPFVPSSFVLWTVAASAAVLIGGLSIAFWPRGNADNDQPPAQTAAAATVELPAQPPAVVNDATPSEPATPQPGQTHVAAKVPDELPAPATEVEPALPDSPAETANDSLPIATPLSDAAAQVSPAPDPAAELGAAPTETSDLDADSVPVLKFDPLDFDPSNLRLAASSSPGGGWDRPTSAGEPATSSVSSAEPAEEADLDVAAVADDAKDAALASTLVESGAMVRLGPMPRGAQAPDGAKQLAFEVGSIQIPQSALGQFIEMVGDVSGAAITLDPIALQLAGVSPQTTISVEGSNVSLEQLLRTALRKHRLDLIANDGHAVIELADASKRSSRHFEFEDLIEPGQTDATELAELIQTFVAPQSWNSAGGQGTVEVVGSKLRVEQTKAAHHELVVFCERLRLARGLAPKSRYPNEMLWVDSPYALLEPKLSQPATFTFLPWARLADVVRHWQDESGITILVDWQKLAEVELGPATPIACSAVDRSWGQVLDEILDTLGLAWWAVDGQTIQITTADALDSIQRVEFYQVPESLRNQFASTGALVESLAGDVQKRENANHTRAEEVQIRVDPQSGRLIVRANPVVHEYLSDRLAERVSQ